MRRLLSGAAWLAVLVLMNPLSARADATVLVGLKSVEGLRPSFGWSFGHRPDAVGFEIEYLRTVHQTALGGYSAGGVFASLIVQPVTISHVQIFAIGGVGIWGEGFSGGKSAGLFRAGNVGGGALVHLAGPLSLRLDYRLFLLGKAEEQGSIPPSTKHPQRIAAGLHFDF